MNDHVGLRPCRADVDHDLFLVRAGDARTTEAGLEAAQEHLVVVKQRDAQPVVFDDGRLSQHDVAHPRQVHHICAHAHLDEARRRWHDGTVPSVASARAQPSGAKPFCTKAQAQASSRPSLCE